MDCTICGKPALPGAMLCAPCKAALKRARYVTVQEDMRRPSIIDARRPSRRARAAPAVAVAEPGRTPRLRLISALNSNSGRPILIGILALAALGVVAHFGQQESGAQSQSDTSAAQVPVPEVRADVAASAAVPPKTETAKVSSPVESATVAGAGIDLASQTQPANKSGGNAAVKRTMLSNRASFATANGDPPDAVAPPPEPEKIAAVAAPPPRPIPDRWQSMRDALTQCDREGLFAGLICGQRVRIQYCEGYWGSVAQCPGAASAYER